MFKLTTPRFLLVETPLHVIQKRLEQDAFEADVPLNGETVAVSFPPEWPGDGFVLFPLLAEQMQRAPATVPWGGMIISRAENVAVGQMSFKALPDAAGSVEIGYGVNPSFQGCGCATEAAKAFVAWALEQPSVTRVQAECLETNVGSVRVLEKAGFRRVGMRFDEEEGGALILWERTA